MFTLSSIRIPLAILKKIFFTLSKTTKPVMKLPPAPCNQLLAYSLAPKSPLKTKTIIRE